MSKTKVNVTGGTAMHGASTTLSDLDAAIRSLEMTTNPTLIVDDDVRRCNCVATRHPLLAAAPNCLTCGKVVCVKEGLGPCTFCGFPLLAAPEVQTMIRKLREERGREKQSADRDALKKTEASRNPALFTRCPGNSLAYAAEARAREHRDKLLGFQEHNAQRTTVRDEAADFDVSGAISGHASNIWATPEDRARELKRQQKILREMQWESRPEYEKRRQVLSIDLAGGKVVRKMVAAERPTSPHAGVAGPENEATLLSGASRPLGELGGVFSNNPLSGGLLKPIYDAKGKTAELGGRQQNKTKGRRVQDDLNGNEDADQDGGVDGGSTT